MPPPHQAVMRSQERMPGWWCSDATSLMQPSLAAAMPLSTRRSESVGDRPWCAYQLNEIGPVVGVHTVMTGRGVEDPTGFCSLWPHIHIGRPTDGPEKPVHRTGSAELAFADAGEGRLIAHRQQTQLPLNQEPQPAPRPRDREVRRDFPPRRQDQRLSRKRQSRPRASGACPASELDLGRRSAGRHVSFV